jgi:hypothetical protein
LDKFYENYNKIQKNLRELKKDYLLLLKDTEGGMWGSTPTLFVLVPNRRIRKITCYYEFPVSKVLNSSDFYKIKNHLNCLEKDTLFDEFDVTLYTYYDVKIRINSKDYYYIFDNYWIDFENNYINQFLKEHNKYKCKKDLIQFIKSLLPIEILKDNIIIEN